MKLVILYRPNSEHGTMVEDFIHDYQTVHHTDSLEIVNIDSKDGIAMATLYDIVRYPAILVIQSDGYLQKSWQGSELPLMEEVAAYLNT